LFSLSAEITQAKQAEKNTLFLYFRFRSPYLEDDRRGSNAQEASSKIFYVFINIFIKNVKSMMFCSTETNESLLPSKKNQQNLQNYKSRKRFPVSCYETVNIAFRVRAASRTKGNIVIQKLPVPRHDGTQARKAGSDLCMTPLPFQPGALASNLNKSMPAILSVLAAV
jgi:hypothetical protein